MLSTTAPEHGGHLCDAVETLSKQCEKRTPCQVQLIPQELVIRAYFQKLTHETTELCVVDTNLQIEQLILHSICCVSFPTQNSYCAFLGCLAAVYGHSHEERRLTVTYPSQLMVTNLRHSFRIPVGHNAGLGVRLGLPGHSPVSVTARNLAESGIEVELAAEWLPLAVGSIVNVQLCFQGGSIDRVAEVRRLADDSCSLMFHHPMDDQSKQQSMSFQKLIRTLQQLWLKNRLV